jgi:hypothetical protein
MHTIIHQVLDVGITLQEPQQLMDNTLEEYALGGEQRETLTKVEAHLIAEDALCARSRTVIAHNALAAYLI